MSSSSANVYETSTQTLFLGRQDFMQKTALSSISSFYNNKKSAPLSPRPLKVLEIGCGTGRFSVYLRDSIESITGPMNAADSLDLTLVDLSPFYLQRARKNHRDYEKFRRRTSSSSTSSRDAKVTYVQGNGEKLDSLLSEDYDIVICMYMFHELPPSARANVASTMSRLTKKGGLAVFTDSIQKGDRPVLDDSIGAFKSFNEPFYDTYLEEDVGALFEQNGMEREEKWLSSVTKTLTFTNNE
jgi:ubiquinone/menaquinone biosynthesis C-methylase UbiE